LFYGRTHGSKRYILKSLSSLAHCEVCYLRRCRRRRRGGIVFGQMPSVRADFHDGGDAVEGGDRSEGLPETDAIGMAYRSRALKYRDKRNLARGKLVWWCSIEGGCERCSIQTFILIDKELYIVCQDRGHSERENLTLSTNRP